MQTTKMTKKVVMIAIAMLCIAAFQNISQGENIGLNEIVYETNNQNDISHSLLMNEISYTAVRWHLFIAGRDISLLDYPGEILEEIKTLEELTKTDVINMLDLSQEKEKALASYLSKCSDALQKGDALSVYLKQEMNVLKNDMESCTNDKNASDKEYFDAVDNYDQKIMESALTASIQFETCATQNRIKYNAETSIINKLVFYLGVLQQKYDMLYAKQDILAENFKVFKDNLLPDLNQIDQLLQQYAF